MKTMKKEKKKEEEKERKKNVQAMKVLRNREKQMASVRWCNSKMYFTHEQGTRRELTICNCTVNDLAKVLEMVDEIRQLAALVDFLTGTHNRFC